MGKARHLLKGSASAHADGGSNFGGSNFVGLPAREHGRIRWGASLAVLLATSMFIVTGCGGSASGANADDAAAKVTDAPLIAAVPADFNSDDLAFVTNASELLRSDQELSDLVASRSSDDGLKAFAQRRSEDVPTQLGVARALSVQWRDDPSPNGDPGQAPVKASAGPDTIARLSAMSGADFDRAWLNAVNDLHTAALNAVNRELPNGKNVDALGLARQMAQTERAAINEVDQMRMRIANG